MSEQMGELLPFRRNLGPKVVPLKPIVEIGSEACHDHTGFETDGLAPQERTVLRTAHDAFAGAMRQASIDTGIILGFSVDSEDAKWQAHRLSEDIRQPLRLVVDDESPCE